MKENKKHITILYTLIVMMTMWCTWTTANVGGFFKDLTSYRAEVHTFQRQVASLIDIANSQEQQDTNVIVNEIIEETKGAIDEVKTESVE